MAIDRPDDIDLWPPPDGNNDMGEMAMDIVLEATKDAVAKMHPEYEGIIRENCLLILQFTEVEGGDRTLDIIHGLVANINGQDRSFYLKDEESERILNTLAPTYNLELARTLVWYHVTDLLAEEKEAEDEWEANVVEAEPERSQTSEDKDDVDGFWNEDDYGEDDGNDFFSSSLPELEAWNESSSEEEDDFDDESVEEMGFDDISFVRVANQNRELRKLYFDLVNGRFSHIE